jgi:hypothetical protein
VDEGTGLTGLTGLTGFAGLICFTALTGHALICKNNMVLD